MEKYQNPLTKSCITRTETAIKTFFFIRKLCFSSVNIYHHQMLLTDTEKPFVYILLTFVFRENENYSGEIQYRTNVIWNICIHTLLKLIG